MTERDENIIRERNNGHTFEEIGKKYRISKTRVMQICQHQENEKRREKDNFYVLIKQNTNGGLTWRTYCALKRSGINSIEDLKELSDDEICKIRNCGKEMQKVIRKIINSEKENP